MTESKPNNSNFYSDLRIKAKNASNLDSDLRIKAKINASNFDSVSELKL